MIDSAWVAWRNAIYGGALIGLASGGLMLLNGRIAGVSGIFQRAVEGDRAPWRWAFLIGLMATGFLSRWLTLPIAPAATVEAHTSIYVGAVIAGLLVGFGTRMGSGCTSGHGICGLARLSPRSLAAVLVFLLTGILVTALMRLMGAM